MLLKRPTFYTVHTVENNIEYLFVLIENLSEDPCVFESDLIETEQCIVGTCDVSSWLTSAWSRCEAVSSSKECFVTRTGVQVRHVACQLFSGDCMTSLMYIRASLEFLERDFAFFQGK